MGWAARRGPAALRAAVQPLQAHAGVAQTCRCAPARQGSAAAVARQGLQFLLNHWNSLVAHCDHGRTKLDTNGVENSIRPSALGKKNWLFVGHPDAGDRAAVIYSLVVSWQRRGIDPFAYLKDVLARLPAMTARATSPSCSRPTGSRRHKPSPWSDSNRHHC